MQSFEKIIHFDDFKQFCKYRVALKCTNEDGTVLMCLRSDKETIHSCPLWRLFKDYIRSDDERKRNDTKKFKKFTDEEKVWEVCEEN